MTGNSLSALGPGRQSIGELLVNLKKIDRNQLDAALNEQANLNAKLGEVLVQQGFISQGDLDVALALQNNHDPQAPLLARQKLGDLLLATGKIDADQLEAALQTQNLTQQKIGDVLQQLGFVSQRDIDSALKLQDSIAFSSRQRILDRLQARTAGDAAQVRQTGPLPSDLAAPFANRSGFLDAAGARAFEAAFGRAAQPNELADFKSKLGFIFGDNGSLADALPQDLNRAAAFQKLSSYFQSVIADRITQLAGGDTVQKQFDRLGNVEIKGLSLHDLELAIQVATAPNYKAQDAGEAFLEKSPRAFFKAMVGRDFATEEEALRFQQLLEGPQAEAIRDVLRRLQGLLHDSFSAFPLAWSDRVARGQITPDEQEILELLAGLREFSAKEALRLWQEKEWWFRKLEVARAIEASSRAQLDAARVEQQVRKILDLIERILGRIPPGLMKLIQQLVGSMGSGSVPNLAALESMILNFVEQIMQMFQSTFGRQPNPDELAQALEVALQSVASGSGDPLAIVQKHLNALKEGKSLQGGMALDKAKALVGQINFEFKGDVSGAVADDDPWVQALVAGDQSPEGMKDTFRQYYKVEGRGIGLPEALTFVEFLHKVFQGAAIEADPFDPSVQKLMNGDTTPGDMYKDWEDQFNGGSSLDSLALSSS